MTTESAHPDRPSDAVVSAAPKACVCGHAREHHDRRESVYAGLMADYKVVWRCGWKGCGCPRFVEAESA